jgi:hypothetical protein
MLCMTIHSSSFSSHPLLEWKLPFFLTTAPLTNSPFCILHVSIMSSFSHILNALSIFSRKITQQLTQEIFTLAALALTVPRIFLIFHGEKNLQFLYTIAYTEIVLILSNLYKNPTLSNRHISFHCFLNLSPSSACSLSFSAQLPHNGKIISKNFQTYNQSMFRITQHLGSYSVRQAGRCGLLCITVQTQQIGKGAKPWCTSATKIILQWISKTQMSAPAKWVCCIFTHLSYVSLQINSIFFKMRFVDIFTTTFKYSNKY